MSSASLAWSFICNDPAAPQIKRWITETLQRSTDDIVHINLKYDMPQYRASVAVTFVDGFEAKTDIKDEWKDAKGKYNTLIVRDERC